MSRLVGAVLAAGGVLAALAVALFAFDLLRGMIRGGILNDALGAAVVSAVGLSAAVLVAAAVGLAVAGRTLYRRHRRQS